jgi:hypothetical protein
MQVDTEPFPMNMVDFEGKRVLIRPNIADKGKDKEVIIGNAREANGNRKISCRKVVAEKTPDGGETLKVTITTSGTGHWGASADQGTGAGAHAAHLERSDAQAQTVRDHARRSGGFQRTIWSYSRPATTAYLQTTTTRDRYVKNKYI